MHSTRKAPRSSTVHLRAIVAAALALGLILTFAAVASAAPAVTIDSGPSGPTSDNMPVFGFTVDGTATSAVCSIDQGPGTEAWMPCLGLATYSPAAPLADGAYTFRVDASDGVDPDTVVTQDFTVDTTGPTLSIDSGQAGPTNVTTPSFTFAVGGDASTVVCSIDQDVPVSCSSPFTAGTALADGRHTFHVQASDALGNTSTDDLDFTVDTTGPALSIDSGQAGPANDATPSFTFAVGGDASTVVCSIDLGTPARCASPYTSAPLSDGRHTFHVQASDALGNASTDDLDFTIDTIRPAVSVTSGPTITRSGTPSFGFTATDTNLASVECSIDRGTAVWVSCPTGPYTPTTPLSDGRYTFRVRATDSAGNQDGDTRDFTVDSQAPSLSIDPGPPDPTNDTTPTFAFTTEAGVSAECSIDQGTPAYQPCTSPYTPVAPLSEGRWTFRVRVTDAVGNEASDSRDITIDTTPPTLSITLGPDGVTNDSTPLFQFAAETGSTVACSIDQGTPAFGPCTGTSAHAVVAPLADGAYTFRVRATDRAGNETIATRAFTVDTVPDAPGGTPRTTPTPTPRVLQLLSPFPVVRIAGELTSTGVRVTLLSVRAPRGALVRVTVRPACGKGRRGSRSCRVVRAAGTVGRHDAIAFKTLARSYRSGTVIVVRVWRADRIGKYTRFTIVRGKAPRRVDQCLAPGATRGSRCPSD